MSIPGTSDGCGYETCSLDFWDADGDPTNGCELYCIQKTLTDSICDFVDDGCDGEVDEDVDLCSSAVNCGKCGRSCEGKLHALGACEPMDPTATDCDELNTKCVIGGCAPGYVDAKHMLADGCEYACTPTQRTDPGDPATLVPCDVTDPTCGAVEYCDGIDNDCDAPVEDWRGSHLGVGGRDALCEGSAVSRTGRARVGERGVEARQGGAFTVRRDGLR